MTTAVNECCVLIPAYREAGRIAPVVRAVLAQGVDVLVVDDGSEDDTAAEARAAGAVVLRHAVNRGKGAALVTGFAWVREQEYHCVITLDADGQHAAEDIGAFIAAYREGKWPVLIGNRMADPVGMPRVRRWTNRYMSRLLSRRMGQTVPDTQCGFRLYECDLLREVTCRASRFDAESEILLALAARGVPMGAVPIRVIYGDERSKIRPLRDTLRFLRMLRNVRKETAACATSSKAF